MADVEVRTISAWRRSDGGLAQPGEVVRVSRDVADRLARARCVEIVETARTEPDAETADRPRRAARKRRRSSE